MDGNSAQRGRHRHRAPSAPTPAWSPHSPQWTPPPDRPTWTDAGRAAPDEARTDWFAPVPSAADERPAPDPSAPARPLEQAWPAETPAPVPSGAHPAPGPARRHPVRHPVRLALYSVVLLGLVAGTLAWITLDKSVRLSVDGEPRSLRTYASTVAGVLDDAGVSVGDHDVLAPGRDAKIDDGAEIVLRRGRLLRMTVDGKPRQVWVTATTVQEALDQVGLRENGMWVSADRSNRLPLDGYDLALRMPKTVTVVADGGTRTVTTTAETVGATLKAAGVGVDGDDRVSQLASAAVVDGMTVTVTRVKTVRQTVRTELKYKTVEKQDPKAGVGSRTVKTPGKDGLQQVTYVATYVNGKLTSRTVASVEVVTRPVDEVVVVGPEAPEEPAPPPAQPAECSDFPTTGGLNWCGLAKCESGLNPNAYNPAGPYYGLYQFDVGTWQSNGGAGTPAGKSIAEQTRVAYNLYQARGASPWPVCGRNL